MCKIIITILIFFDSFSAEHIPKEIKAFINNNNNINSNNNKNIRTNIFRIQAYDSIMRGYFYIGLLILCLQEKL